MKGWMMNIKQKFEDLKKKVSENRPQIVAALTTVSTVVLTVMLVESNRSLAKANRQIDEAHETIERSNETMTDAIKHFDGPIRLGVGDCAFDALKDGNSIFWHSKGHHIDLAYDPDVVCDNHDLHTKKMSED